MKSKREEKINVIKLFETNEQAFYKFKEKDDDGKECEVIKVYGKDEYKKLNSSWLNK